MDAVSMVTDHSDGSCSGLIGTPALIGLSCHSNVMEKLRYCSVKLYPLSFSANKTHHS